MSAPDALQENLKRVDALLARFRDRPLLHFINGQLVASTSGALFENTTPTDDSRLGNVAAGGSEDIDAAARAASAAFVAWRDTPPAERRHILHRIADLILARREEIALIESMDTGQPLRFMSQAAVRGAENFRFFADRAQQVRDGLCLPAEQHLNYTLRAAIGAVGVITPWNTPFMLSTWKIAPALAAGCSVVHKPAEWSPLTAALLAEIASEAGLPNGVLNVVHGVGESAGKALTEHPAIKAIAFVGDCETGRQIVVQGANTLKRVHLELGGKNPVIVFDDADLERALDAVVFMIFSCNGERCTSSSRLLVENSIHDSFVNKLCDRVRRLKVGHPLDPATEIGPLIHPLHVAKVLSYFDVARQEGATVCIGGERSAAKGNYVSPTVFDQALGPMRIAQEEIFGPVLTVISFEDEAEALELGNGVPFGLAAYLWTNDISRAHRLADRLEAGMIWVNSENNRHLPTPFGGMKDSGIGRDGGDYSFDFFTERKNVCVSLGQHRIPQLGTSA
jgi:5-carboxymethyl-2-hydroxymuconic-semialdehyde dehydrogenase